MTATLTDDELSELAECLDDACAEAIRKGKRIQPCDDANFHETNCCPFGALMGFAYPFPHLVSAYFALPLQTVEDFMGGFDVGDPSRKIKSAAFQLGRYFRERYVTGGGK